MAAILELRLHEGRTEWRANALPGRPSIRGAGPAPELFSRTSSRVDHFYIPQPRASPNMCLVSTPQHPAHLRVKAVRLACCCIRYCRQSSPIPERLKFLACFLRWSEPACSAVRLWLIAWELPNPRRLRYP